MPKPKFDTNKNHTSSPSNHSPVQQQSPQNSHQTPHLVLNQINGTVSVAGGTGQDGARQILTSTNGQAIELKLQSPMDDLGLSGALSKQIPIKVIQTVPLQSVQTDASGQQTVVREVTINDS